MPKKSIQVRTKIKTKKPMNWRYEETLPAVCKFDKQICQVNCKVQSYRCRFADVLKLKKIMEDLLAAPTTAEHFAESLSEALGKEYVCTIYWTSPSHGPIEIIA